MGKEVGTHRKTDRMFILDKLYVPHIFGIHSITTVSSTDFSFMS